MDIFGSGRWDEVGTELFRLKDQHGVEFCLGPVSAMCYGGREGGEGGREGGTEGGRDGGRLSMNKALYFLRPTRSRSLS